MSIQPSSRYFVQVGSVAVVLAVVGAAALSRNRPSASTKATARSAMLCANPSTVSGASADASIPSVLSPKETKNSKIWNRFADDYSKSPIKDEVSYQKKLEITREYLTTSSNVLEFGCGTGGTAILHSPYVRKIRAIDLSSRMIEIAQEKADAANVENVAFECTGIDSLSANHGDGDESESYDMILAMSILHLLPNKDEILGKVHQLLKPGGYFVSSTSCLGDFARFLGWIAPLGNWLGLLPSLNIFSKAELLQSMEEAGFDIEREFHPEKNKAVFLVARKKERTQKQR